MRFIKTRSVAISLAGLAIAVTGALAQPAGAHAAVPIGGPIGGPIALPCPLPIFSSPPTDLVRLSGVGVDFGTGGMDGNDARCSGTVDWDTANNTLKSIVDGEMYTRNSLGASFRTRAEFRDVYDNLIGSANSASVTATTNAVQTFPIHLESAANPLVYRTDVVTQVSSGGVWTDVSRQSVHLSSSTKAPDSVTVVSAGMDFGSGGLSGGAPVSPGTVTWNRAANNTTVELDGELYMINALGQTARLRVRTFDVHGNVLSSRAGSSHTPTSNALHTYAINLDSLPSPLIYSAEVAIQVQVGASWQVQGTPVTVLI